MVPAWGKLAMALAIGTRLGAYEITGTIGAGGMGEVYRARDTSLRRDVAIKVLPAALASDSDRLARLQREAEVLAALNHPNIAQVYGIERSAGTTALAMELVDGVTLLDRISHGAIPVEESLAIADQIADALDAAHSRGIVHRDLKPANITLRPDGMIKVLDFGIAKAMNPHVTARGDAPSLTTPALTQAGVVLGTAAYMSPEQAKGKAVDARTDIWAFGCVLYEMLTGQSAFMGEDVTTTLARVLERAPDFALLPSNVPPAVRRALELCLQKDARRRLADIRDVKLVLGGMLADATSSRPVWRRAVALAALGGVLLIGALMSAIYVLNEKRARIPVESSLPAARLPVTRFVITPPASAPLAAGTGLDIAISADGQRIAYMTHRADGDVQDVVVRELDALEANPIPDGPLKAAAMRGGNPFFSPDGASLGFIGSEVPGIVRLSLGNEPGVRILEEPGFYFGGAWADDGSIVYSNGASVVRIAAGGGTREVLTTTQEPTLYATTDVLPGGHALLVATTENSGTPFGIAALDLETHELKPLVADAEMPKYVESGHIVFVRGSTIMAVPFNVAELAVTGDAVALVPSVRRPATLSAPDFAVSRSGTLIYVPGSGAAGPPLSAVVWVDRAGNVLGRAFEDLVENPRSPHLSPDGQSLLLLTGDDIRAALWRYDLAGRPPVPLALAGNHSWGVWSPDGRRVAYVEVQSESGGLIVAPADGSLVGGELLSRSLSPWPLVWSAADELLLMGNPAEDQSQYDIYAMRAAPDSPVRVIVGSEYSEISPALSPDGQLLAYLSTRTGEFELWLQRYPDGAPIRVSRNGALEPVWSRDGRELYYIEGDALMAARVENGTELSVTTPARLFSGLTRAYFFPVYTTYDVAPDGRFLVIEPPARGDDAPASDSIVVVQNWIEELRDRVRPSLQ